LAGCHKLTTPEAVAEAFIDHYYIERDHPQALLLATGIAAARVAEEQRLVDEGRSAGATASAVQPHVYYRLRKVVPKGADSELTFDLTIDSGGVSLQKEVRVVTSRVGEQWKVSFFNESDLQ
jgi:hypothetical protein